MFAKRKKQPTIELSKLSSLVAEDVEIVGDLSFAGGIRIDGRIKGNVIARAVDGQPRALLVLSEKGRIEGRVNCGDAVINGSVVGDLEVENFLELQSNARVSGTIRYQHLRMDVGAEVRGQLLKPDDALPGTLNVVELGADKAAGARLR
ncbi:MAG TPA: polymer-forming cytoskeletal protein [Burkholderiaceae bacterium]|nr:polymer-forming cytoskeletal protein [Burkholderiaceae bacterium]